MIKPLMRNSPFGPHTRRFMTEGLVPKKMLTPIAQAIRGARVKLLEAHYFLRLMDHVEHQRAPLVDGNDFASEYGFLLSGLLNACYSVIEYLRGAEEPAKDLAEAFKRAHAAYYAHGTGRRSVSVHLRPVVPGHRGYRPPSGNNVAIRFAGDRYEPPPGNQVGFDLDEGARFYYDDSIPQSAIGDSSAAHLVELQGLIDECEQAALTLSVTK
jgi:hypothetical protein